MFRAVSIGKSFASLVLLMVFLVPSIVQAVHVFQGDEHFTCDEKVEHMHEMVSDCPVCHFHMASFPYELVGYPDFTLPVLPTTNLEQRLTLLLRSFQRTAVQLRAPPEILG